MTDNAIYMDKNGIVGEYDMWWHKHIEGYTFNAVDSGDAVEVIRINGEYIPVEFVKVHQGYICRELDGKRWDFDNWGFNFDWPTRKKAAHNFCDKIKEDMRRFFSINEQGLFE